MATCRFCDAETELYDDGRPTCLKCADLLEAGKQPPQEQPPTGRSVPGELPSGQKSTMIGPAPRLGYAMIDSVSRMAADSDAWETFMRDVIQMPLSMLEAVQYAVRANKWKVAHYPLLHVRTSAENWTARRRLAGLRSSIAKG